jgi:hypothetical protein
MHPIAATRLLAPRPFSALLLGLGLLTLLGGCAAGAPQLHLTADFGLSSPSGAWLPSPSTTSPSSARPVEVSTPLSAPSVDAFQQVQQASGLEPEARHPAGSALYPQQARQLWVHLSKTPVTPSTFAPRRVLFWLLREALSGSERVDYPDLRWRAERFIPLVLVRTDGYLVTALTGSPLQHLGKLQLVDGHWKVGVLEPGAFYFSRSGVFYPVTPALRRADGPPVAELGLGRDPLNAALDGAQDALVEMTLALAQSLRHPIRTVHDLGQLPDDVARLLAASPAYFARYGAMSREDQIREAARLSTHLLLMLGGATEATAGGMGGLGAGLPVLSLTAEGELVLDGALVSQGTVITAVGTELGALSTLHMASSSGQGSAGDGSGTAGNPPQTPPARSPGRWMYKKPTTQSQDSLDYQEQVTGRPAWWVYMIGKVEFDGFKAGELLEAKGPGYCAFFNADGTPKYWYVNSGKFAEMMKQAEEQSKLAQSLGMPLTWHVADARVAKFLGEVFKDNNWTNTTVRHTPLVR